jgi:hypothetical protein
MFCLVLAKGMSVYKISFNAQVSNVKDRYKNSLFLELLLYHLKQIRHSNKLKPIITIWYNSAIFVHQTFILRHPESAQPFPILLQSI